MEHCNCILDHIRSDQRPCFNINGLEYVSAGILFWTEDVNHIYHLLLQKTNFQNSYIIEDFGGKSDLKDQCIREVAIRECLEELNFKIKKEDLQKKFQEKEFNTILIPDCKYILYLIYLDPTYIDLYTSNLFGTEELHEHINRSVIWMSYKDYIKEHYKNKLNPRLSKCTDDLLIFMCGILKSD